MKLGKCIAAQQGNKGSNMIWDLTYTDSCNSKVWCSIPCFCVHCNIKDQWKRKGLISKFLYIYKNYLAANRVDCTSDDIYQP